MGWDTLISPLWGRTVTPTPGEEQLRTWKVQGVGRTIHDFFSFPRPSTAAWQNYAVCLSSSCSWQPDPLPGLSTCCENGKSQVDTAGPNYSAEPDVISGSPQTWTPVTCVHTQLVQPCFSLIQTHKLHLMPVRLWVMPCMANKASVITWWHCQPTWHNQTTVMVTQINRPPHPTLEWAVFLQVICLLYVEVWTTDSLYWGWDWFGPIFCSLYYQKYQDKQVNPNPLSWVVIDNKTYWSSLHSVGWVQDAEGIAEINTAVWPNPVLGVLMMVALIKLCRRQTEQIWPQLLLVRLMRVASGMAYPCEN